MGLFLDLALALLSSPEPKRRRHSRWDDDPFRENNSWFEHSGEDHDEEDGYCMECDDEIDDLDE